MKNKRLQRRKGYMLLGPVLHTVSNCVQEKPKNTGIELRDNIRWWTKDHGHFNYNLYIQVINAKPEMP